MRARQGYTRYSDSYVLVDPNPGYVPEVQREQQRLGCVHTRAADTWPYSSGIEQLHSCTPCHWRSAWPQVFGTDGRPLPVRAWLALGLVVAVATYAIRRVFTSSATVELDTYQSPTQVRSAYRLPHRP